MRQSSKPKDYSIIPLETLCWSAGFFDGEGCIVMYSVKNKYQTKKLRIHVEQIVLEPLLKLQDNFGGSIYVAYDPETVVIKKGNAKLRWRWTAAGKTAQLFLEHTLNYLVVKREKAELALSMSIRAYAFKEVT